MCGVVSEFVPACDFLSEFLICRRLQCQVQPLLELSPTERTPPLCIRSYPSTSQLIEPILDLSKDENEKSSVDNQCISIECRDDRAL